VGVAVLPLSSIPEIGILTTGTYNGRQHSAGATQYAAATPACGATDHFNYRADSTDEKF